MACILLVMVGGLDVESVLCLTMEGWMEVGGGLKWLNFCCFLLFLSVPMGCSCACFRASEVLNDGDESMDRW